MLFLTMSQRCAAMATVLLVVASCPFPLVAQQRPAKAPYLDPALPAERRADDLVSRMTLEEKISQMMNAAPAISRLGIPEYDWWNEALHGVAFSGVATVFPQAIGLGRTRLSCFLALACLNYHNLSVINTVL